MFDIAVADELETFFRITGPVNVDESRLERILKSPATLVGISDGGAHLQTFAGGDYTSYFLAHWVREKGAFTLEEGVAALTSRVADFLGLTDRGTLEVGKAADVVGLRPRHRRAAAAPDARRHPRRRHAHDQGRQVDPVGARQRRPGHRGRQADRRDPRRVLAAPSVG